MIWDLHQTANRKIDPVWMRDQTYLSAKCQLDSERAAQEVALFRLNSKPVASLWRVSACPDAMCFALRMVAAYSTECTHRPGTTSKPACRWHARVTSCNVLISLSSTALWGNLFSRVPSKMQPSCLHAARVSVA